MARQRVSALKGELVSLCVHHAEAVKDAEESWKKLLAVLAHSHHDDKTA